MVQTKPIAPRVGLLVWPASRRIFEVAEMYQLLELE